MNHYEILEVSPKASPEVIKAAYKSLMQRYHPDRNPGDAKIAEHAILVGRAYEVLSDPARRAAYDIELQQRSSASAIVFANARPKPNALHARYVPGEEESSSSIGRWLLPALAAILLGVFFWIRPGNHTADEPVRQASHSPFGARQFVPEPAQDQAKRDIQPQQEIPASPKAEAKPGDELAARTIPVYMQDLTVMLKPSDGASNEAGHILRIATLGVTVGAFDADKFLQYIKDNKAVIGSKLAEKLADAKYEQLGKSGGGAYLKGLILDAIGEITGADRFKEYPAPSGGLSVRYGVVDVVLPDSFSIR